jgi:MFS family permease
LRRRYRTPQRTVHERRGAARDADRARGARQLHRHFHRAVRLLRLVPIPAFAALSDGLGRRPVYLAGALFVGLFAFPFFWLVDSGVPALIWLALVQGLTGVAAMYGPQAAFFSELFGTNVRYSGASLGSQLAAPIAGGLVPLVATALLGWSRGQPWPVALYMIGMVLITFSSVFLAVETARTDLSSR